MQGGGHLLSDLLSLSKVPSVAVNHDAVRITINHLKIKLVVSEGV